MIDLGFRNYQIQNIKETKLISSSVAKHYSHYLLETENSNSENIIKKGKIYLFLKLFL